MNPNRLVALLDNRFMRSGASLICKEPKQSQDFLLFFFFFAFSQPETFGETILNLDPTMQPYNHFPLQIVYLW